MATPTPDSYFTFTLLSNDTYEIKAKDKNNMPAEVAIPSTYNGKAVTSIGNQAFYDCTSLTSITIPNSVTSIGSSAFQACKNLKAIEIPNSVTSISILTFYRCSSLTSLTIPGSVISIGNIAFGSCSNLTTITCKATTPPTIQSNTFNNVPTDCAIYVPAASVETYKTATNWSARKDYIQAIYSVTYNLTNCSKVSGNTTIGEGENLYLSVRCDKGYNLTLDNINATGISFDRIEEEPDESGTNIGKYGVYFINSTSDVIITIKAAEIIYKLRANGEYFRGNDQVKGILTYKYQDANKQWITERYKWG